VSNLSDLTVSIRELLKHANEFAGDPKCMVPCLKNYSLKRATVLQYDGTHIAVELLSVCSTILY
jgi:hypothetical protein